MLIIYCVDFVDWGVVLDILTEMYRKYTIYKVWPAELLYLRTVNALG